MMQFIEWFKQKGLSFVIPILIIFIIGNAVIIFYYKGRISDASDRFNTLISIRSNAHVLADNAATTDLTARNYMLTFNTEVLKQYDEALVTFATNYDSLLYQLRREEVEPALTKNIAEAGASVMAHKELLSILHAGDSATIHSQFERIPRSTSSINSFLFELTNNEKLVADEIASANDLLNVSMMLQILLMLGIPSLLFFNSAYFKYRTNLVLLNKEIEESNQKYVFNSLDEVDYENSEAIKARLLNNLKRATDFIQNVSKGNYDIKWEGMNEVNRHANLDNIAGELIRMREQMKQVKEQDRVRIWVTEGLSKFGEIIRKHQDNFDTLSDSLISNVVKYVDAKVGGLFIVEEEGEGQKFLGLRACYAYDRKKFVNRRVEIGEGLIGQAYLEGVTTYLKKVPQEYMSITSGLGEQNPSCLLVVPLKANEKIEGVLELASFKEFQPYEIEFLEKLGETLASSIVSVRSAEKTKILLQVSQEQSEQMRAQEEEMRQNMEELEATQEQMNRQVAELNTLKTSLEKEKYLFGSLMDTLPDAIYFKDRDCKLIRVSTHMVKEFGIPEEALIGKSDFDFQDEEHAREAYNDEQNIMETRKPKIDYVEKEVRPDGTEIWVSTTKLPLLNLTGEVVGTFGISRNVSKLKKLEQDLLIKDKRLKEEEKQYEEKIKSLEEAIKVKDLALQKNLNK